MNCSEAKQRLQDRLDGVLLQAGADLDRHLADCRECRSLHAAASRLLHGLSLMAAPAPTDHLHAVIVREVLTDLQAQLRFRQRLLALTALAAGLLLVVTTFWLQRPSELPVAATKATPNMVEPPLAKPPSLRASFTEASEALVSLTRRTADETVGQTRLLIPESIPAPLPVPDEVPALETPAQVWAGASQGMSAGLQPLATSARRAFSMLLRENPDEKR